MSCRRKKVALLLIIAVCASSALLGALNTGDSLPPFSVVSGDGKILIHADLTGKTAFLFYEDRTKLDMNQDLKSFLMSKGYNDDLVRIVVIADCTNAGLRKRLWESSLVDYSRRTGITAYGDWNGGMKQGLNTAADSSSFYVVSPAGQVVYFREGLIPQGEFGTIHAFAAP